MPDKAWKRAEREIAERLGGKRVPITGRQRGDAPDIAHDRLSLEVKSRKTLPEWIKDAMRQARAANADGTKLPAVVLHEQGKRYLDAIVCMPLREFRDWFGDVELVEEGE